MKLADEHLAEFQALFKKHFGIEISKSDALQRGLRLIQLTKIVSLATAKNEKLGSLKNTDNK